MSKTAQEIFEIFMSPLHTLQAKAEFLFSKVHRDQVDKGKHRVYKNLSFLSEMIPMLAAFGTLRANILKVIYEDYPQVDSIPILFFWGSVPNMTTEVKMHTDIQCVYNSRFEKNIYYERVIEACFKNSDTVY